MTQSIMALLPFVWSQSWIVTCGASCCIILLQAAQQRREDKKKAEKEKMLNEPDADKTRKWEASASN